MSKLLLSLSTLLFASCSSGPVATQKGVWMGGSAMTKVQGYYAEYDGPFGKIKVGSAAKDETVVPGKVVNYYGIKAVTQGAVDMLNTTESTKKVLGAQDVTKQGIQSAERVESLRILNPVEVVPAP